MVEAVGIVNTRSIADKATRNKVTLDKDRASMTRQPTAIERSGDERLRIHWSGPAGEEPSVREYTVIELRDACPCATCREKRKQEPPSPSELTILSPAEAAPLRILGMKPVGSYAYGIEFSDGHDTGIFTLELLQKLGQVVES